MGGQRLIWPDFEVLITMSFRKLHGDARNDARMGSTHRLSMIEERTGIVGEQIKIAGLLGIGAFRQENQLPTMETGKTM